MWWAGILEANFELYAGNMLLKKVGTRTCLCCFFAECEISHTHTSALMRPLHVWFKLHQRTLTVSAPELFALLFPKWSNFVTHKYLVQRSVYSVTRWLRASYWPYVTCEANRLKQLINIFDNFYQNLKLKKPFQENEIKKRCLVLRKLQEGTACAAGCENERFPSHLWQQIEKCSLWITTFQRLGFCFSTVKRRSHVYFNMETEPLLPSWAKIQSSCSVSFNMKKKSFTHKLKSSLTLRALR